MWTPLPAYAELHCLSSFSFQRGASLPEELVARAAALGYSALAITDECSVAGVVTAMGGRGYPVRWRLQYGVLRPARCHTSRR